MEIALAFFDDSRYAKIALISIVITWMASFLLMRGIVGFDLVIGIAMIAIILNLLAHYHKEKKSWIILVWVIIIPFCFCGGGNSFLFVEYVLA